jgi:hypothetical protein
LIVTSVSSFTTKRGRRGKERKEREGKGKGGGKREKSNTLQSFKLKITTLASVLSNRHQESLEEDQDLHISDFRE